MNVVVSSPQTGVYVQQTVRAFSERRMLAKYLTTFADHPASGLSRSLKKSLKPFGRKAEALFSRRRISGIPGDACEFYEWPELFKSVVSRLGAPARVSDRIWEWSELSFDRWAASRLTAAIDAVYVYEHAALFTARRARALGKKVFYEQPTPHYSFYQRIFAGEQEKYPGVGRRTPILSDKKTLARINRRRDEELAIADFVVCNSSLTKRTLVEAGVDGRKIETVRLGFPEISPRAGKAAGGKVIFMNAGTQSVRKGLHILCRAWRELAPDPEAAELWLIGKQEIDEAWFRDLPGKVMRKGSIPRDELLDLYRKASVFVMPSLCDGFGMSVTEAMSRGVPVIATDAVGSADFIQSGVNGWVVRAGDPEAIARQMRWCIDHAGRLGEFSAAALKTAATWTWDDYRNAIADLVAGKIGGPRRP